MILTKEHQEACINAYIKAGHNQDECIGFIDGFEKAMSLVKNCNTPAVSKCEGLRGRELLLDFAMWEIQDKEYQDDIEIIVDEYIRQKSSNSC
jgi:hypothetical protein